MSNEKKELEKNMEINEENLQENQEINEQTADALGNKKMAVITIIVVVLLLLGLIIFLLVGGKKMQLEKIATIKLRQNSLIDFKNYVSKDKLILPKSFETLSATFEVLDLNSKGKKEYNIKADMDKYEMFAGFSSFGCLVFILNDENPTGEKILFKNYKGQVLFSYSPKENEPLAGISLINTGFVSVDSSNFVMPQYNNVAYFAYKISNNVVNVVGVSPIRKVFEKQVNIAGASNLNLFIKDNNLYLGEKNSYSKPILVTNLNQTDWKMVKSSIATQSSSEVLISKNIDDKTKFLLVLDKDFSVLKTFVLHSGENLNTVKPLQIFDSQDTNLSTIYSWQVLYNEKKKSYLLFVFDAYNNLFIGKVK